MKLQDSLRLITEYLSDRGMVEDFESYVNDQGFELKDMNLDRSVLDEYLNTGAEREREDTIWA